MSKRRDKCKCGKLMTWDTDDNKVVCPNCGTVYTVEADSVLAYWLEEKAPPSTLHKTDARW